MSPTLAQHAKNDHQFEKDQTKMLLQQLNFPRLTNMAPPRPYYNRDLLHWTLPESIIASVFSSHTPHPREPGIAQRAAATSSQQGPKVLLPLNTTDSC